MRKQSKRNLLAMLALSSAIAMGCGAASLTASADEATLPEGNVDIYLIAGQSNAVGYSPKGTENATYENVWYVGDVDRNKDKNGAAENMKDVSTYKNVTAGMGKSSDHIGPEYGMAKALNSYYSSSNRKALIVKSAAGGTHIAYTGGQSATFGNWLPSSLWSANNANPSENGDSDPNGVQYYHFIENFKAAYTELKAEGYTPVVKGMVWMQGESDVATPNYETLLSTLIDDFRSDIYTITQDESNKTLPFIVGEISSPKCGDYLSAFTATQRKVVNSKTNAYLVKSNDLSYVTTDQWHLTTESAVTLGERFGLTLAENASIAPAADVVVSGASVYIGASDEDGVDKSGIRFRILAKEEIVQNYKVHALLVPADLVDNTELGKGMQVEGGKTMVDEELTDWFVSEHPGYKETYVTLYNFTEDAYNREILVNAYLENSSGEAYSYAKTISRSMSYVALRAEQNGNDVAAKYIKTYNVDFYGDDQTEELRGYENVTARYGSLVAEPEVEDTETKYFIGWYKDKEFKEPFDFKFDTIKGTTKLYSKWGDLQTVTGSYAYTSGDYADGKITNAGDTVTVKSGDRTGTVDTTNQTYSITLPASQSELTLSSNMFRDVKVSISGNTANTATFSVPKVTPEVSVNNVTYLEDGFKFTNINSCTNDYTFDGNVTATEGFVVKYTATDSGSTWLHNALLMKNGDSYFGIGLATNSLAIISDTKANHWSGTNGYVGTLSAVASKTTQTITIVYFNGSFYVQREADGVEKSVQKFYSGSTVGWNDTYQASICAATSYTLGLSAPNSQVTYENVCYLLGNEIAKKTMKDLGIEQSYTLAQGKFQNFKDNATTKSGEGFYVQYTTTKSTNWMPYGTVLVTIGTDKYAVGTNGAAIVLKKFAQGVGTGSWSASCLMSALSGAMPTTGEVTITLAYYKENFYFKATQGDTVITATFNAQTANGYSTANSHVELCASTVKTLGLASGDCAATFTNVSYAIGDDTAKTTIEAMGFTLSEE